MMQEVIYIWVALLSDMLNVIIVVLFIRAQFSVFRGKKITVAMCLIAYYLVMVSFHLKPPFPGVLLFVNLPFILLITLFYEGTTQKRILSTLFTYVLLALIEFAGIGASLLFKQYTSPFQFDLIKLIIIKVALLAFLQIYTRISKKGVIHSRVKMRTWVTLFLIPILSFGVAVLFAFFLQVLPIYTLCVITVLVIMNFLVFMLYNELNTYYVQEIKMQSIKNQSNYYRQYLQDLMDHQETLMLYQHDIKNRLLAIHSYLDADDIRTAKGYIQKLIEIKATPREYAQTGIIEIDSVVNDKLTQAAESGANIVFKAVVPKDLHIDADDFIVILGNMLDNALEALHAVQQEARFIHLSLEFACGALTIRMKNSFATKRKVSSGKYFTTKTDTQLHGHGLNSINAITEKYNGSLECKDEENIFMTNTILFEQ